MVRLLLPWWKDSLVLSCDLRTAVKTAAQPSPKPLGLITFALVVDYIRVTCKLMPFFLLTFCADGGKGVSSVEKNGDQCGRSREENGKEHGEHAGNVHGLPHRNTVGVNQFCCIRHLLSDCVVFWEMQTTSGLIHNVCRPAESVLEGATPAAPDTLWRRYSEFELLRTYLLVTYPYVIIPPLPEKRVRMFTGIIYVQTLW